MGATTSKPNSQTDQHVFTSDTAVRFSPELLNSLQSSPESDKTRAADLEAHVQSRVQAELKRIESETDKAIKDLEESISKDTKDKPDQQEQPQESTVSGAISQAFTSEPATDSNLSRNSVQKEIDTLKSKLAARKLRDDVVGDKEVEHARDKVVNCLRLNDRRPLDCWKEVDDFKREVGRLEGQFLGKVLE